VAFFLVCYYLAGRFVFSFAGPDAGAAAIWLLSGPAIAAALLWGHRVWPGISAGAFFVNLALTGSWRISLAVAVGSAAGTLVGLYLIDRAVLDRHIFDRTKNAVYFILLAGFAGAAVGATVGTFLLAVLGGLAWGTAAVSAWFAWWMSGATGVLLIAPLLIMWGNIPEVSLELKRVGYFLLVLLLTAVMEKIAFGGLLPFIPPHFPLAFIALPPLIIGAFWLGRRWEIAAVFFLAVLATRDTLLGMGPFAVSSLNGSLLLLQMFLGVCAVTALIVSTLIDERREALRLLGVREQYFRALIEKSSDGILLVDGAGNVKYASPTLKKMTGYEWPDGPAGNPLFHLVYPDDAGVVREYLKKIAGMPERTIDFEVRARHHDGRPLWLSMTATNLLQYEPVQAVVMNVRDITREKESQQAKSYLASIVESADDAIIGKDLKGIIHSWNHGAEKLYGYAAEEAIGQPITLIMPSDRRRTEYADIMQHVMQGEHAHYETVRVRKDGTLLPVSFSASPVWNQAGSVIGASIIAHDATKEKELERRKHEFISSLSYQLRNPVGEIGTYIDSLTKRKNHFTPLEQQYLLKIENANLRMAMLVQNLLRVTRLTLDTVPISPRPTELKREIDYVAREFAEKLGAKTIALERPYRQSRAVTVTLDPALFSAALGNLFAHALASVPPAGTVSVDFIKSDHDIQVNVRESRGAPVEGMALKDEGPRAPDALNADDPSLDIYVAQSLVERIGGTLRSERTHDGQTRFSIVFPLKQ
jgi:PAS domain S-box-containing protein